MCKPYIRRDEHGAFVIFGGCVYRPQPTPDSYRHLFHVEQLNTGRWPVGKRVRVSKVRNTPCLRIREMDAPLVACNVARWSLHGVHRRGQPTGAAFILHAVRAQMAPSAA